MIMGYTIIVFFFLIFIILFHPIYYSVSTYRIQSHARINACKYQIQLWWYHKRSHRARDLSTNSRSWSTLCFRITLGKLCFYSCVLLLSYSTLLTSATGFRFLYWLTLLTLLFTYSYSFLLRLSVYIVFVMLILTLNHDDSRILLFLLTLTLRLNLPHVIGTAASFFLMIWHLLR